MKLCTLLFVIWMTCSVTDGLKCWRQSHKNGLMRETYCNPKHYHFTSIGELGKMSCLKRQYGGWDVVRGCARKLYDGCKTDNNEITICFCKSDLCNTGSNTKTSNTFHILIVSVAMVVTTLCIKLAFI